jgi:hypothetical protein
VINAPAYARADLDWYVEPSSAVEQLAEAVDFDGCVIWDPACGSGTIPDVFADRGLDVVGSDLVDRGFEDCVAPHNFLTDDHRLVVGGRFAIVTNPPYGYERGVAERFIRRALGLPAVRAAFLLPLGFLASRARHELFTERPPSDVLILSQRPSMPPGDRIDQLGDRAFRGGTTDYCWIVWTRPHDRETRLRWLLPQTATTLKEAG